LVLIAPKKEAAGRGMTRPAGRYECWNSLVLR
jgi:hypothetical protein